MQLRVYVARGWSGRLDLVGYEHAIRRFGARLRLAVLVTLEARTAIRLEGHFLALVVEDLEDLVREFVLDVQLLGTRLANGGVGEAIALADINELLSELMHSRAHARVSGGR